MNKQYKINRKNLLMTLVFTPLGVGSIAFVVTFVGLVIFPNTEILFLLFAIFLGLYTSKWSLKNFPIIEFYEKNDD